MKKQLPAEIKEAVHADLGASNCERWWNCSLSPRMVASVLKGKRDTNVYAAEGSVAHEIAAEFLISQLQQRTPKFVVIPGVTKREYDGFKFTVNQEMLDAVYLYVDFVLDILDTANVAYTNSFVETRIRIPHSSVDLFGTSDCIVYIPYTRIIAIDFKYGAGTPVPAKNNKQLLYYALGALLALPEDEQDNYPEIEMVIVQPRTPGDPIDSWTIPVDEIWKFHAELLAAADRTLSLDASLNAGDWCKYCAAKPICPALKDKVQETAGLDFANLPANVINSLELPTLKDDPEIIANVLNHKSMIENWLDAYHKRAFELAEQGVEIPGYQLVEKWSHRRLNEIGQQYAEIMLSNGAFKVEYKSPAQIEEAMKAKGLQKHLVKGKLSEAYTEKDNQGKALAKVGAKGRKPALPSAVSDFAAVDYDEDPLNYS